MKSRTFLLASVLLAFAVTLTVVAESNLEYGEADERASVFFDLIPQDNVTDVGRLTEEEELRLQLGVQFFAFPNRNNPKQYTEIKFGDPNSLARSGLIPGQPVHIFAHGFGGKAPQRKHYSIINAYINENTPNVVVVNYQSTYPALDKLPVVMGVSWFAAQWKYAPSAGQRVADFIVFLQKNRIISDSSQVHLLGHSLGGHVMGVAGHRLQTQHGMRVGRITGLDVAGPLYKNIPIENKLDSSDAAFVDVVHTNIDGVGIADSIGHVDYYSNGGLGRSQNGCQFRNGLVPIVAYVRTIICSHDERPLRIWGYGVSRRVNLQACPCLSSSYGKRRRRRVKVKSLASASGFQPVTPVSVNVNSTSTGVVVPDGGDSQIQEDAWRVDRGICERPARSKCIRFGELTPPKSRGRYFLPITDRTFRQIMDTSRRNEA